MNGCQGFGDVLASVRCFSARRLMDGPRKLPECILAVREEKREGLWESAPRTGTVKYLVKGMGL